MHKNILILSLAALLGCAHEEAQTLTTERDWEKGLDATHGPQIAPVGPIDSDQSAYNYIRRREQDRDLGSRMTAAGIRRASAPGLCLPPIRRPPDWLLGALPSRVMASGPRLCMQTLISRPPGTTALSAVLRASGVG